MAQEGIKPAVLLAGIAVIGGVALFAAKKKARCTKLPGIWEEEGPLHMTQEATDEAFEHARHKIREFMVAGEAYKLSDVQFYVADQLRDCAWEKLETDQQKDVWAGIYQIVNEVDQRAAQDPDGFLQSMNQA